MKISLIFKVMLPVAILMGVFAIFSPQKAFAVYENNQNVPSFISNFDKNCRGFGHAQFNWLSNANNNNATTVTIDEGTTSVNLRLNVMSAQCNPNIDGNGNIINRELKITRSRATSAISQRINPDGSTGAQIGNVTGIQNTYKDLNYNDSYFLNLRYITSPPATGYMPEYQTFTVRDLGNLEPGNHTIRVTVMGRAIHRYERANGTVVFVCVNAQGTYQVVGSLDDPACALGPTSYDINVVVNSLKAGTVDQVCPSFPGIRGWALTKPNRYYRPEIHVYVDGPPGGGRVGQVFTPGPEPVNGVEQPPGPGEYKITRRADVKAAYFPQEPTYDAFGYEILTTNMGDSIKYAFDDATTHPVYVYAVGGDGSNLQLLASYPINGQAGQIPIAGPCNPSNVRSCSAVNINVIGRPAIDNIPEAGQSFTVTASYRNGQPTFTDAIISIVKGEVLADSPSPAPTPLAGTPTTIPSTGGKTVTSPGVYTLTDTEVYTARVRFRWGSPATDNMLCTQTFKVARKPYLKVYGNDISAGGDFNTAPDKCNASANKASILAFARNNGVGGPGASTQLAAYALGQIWEFSSAASSPGAPAVPPKGLTFGNYASTATYGGEGGQYRCITDYFSVVSANIPSAEQNVSGGSSGGTPIDLGATAQGRYKVTTTTPVRLTNTANVSGTHALVIDGDVYIGDDGITYAGGATSVQNLPSVYIIAKGNIYIAMNAAQINGVLIAQPRDDGTKGKIYTCANANGTSLIISTINYFCDQKLTVNGAFIAQNIKFWRSNGTLSASSFNEASGSGNIAESFNPSPELYLTAPPALKKANSGSRTYDSVTSLPPVL